jgi:hypothetical protein
MLKLTSITFSIIKKNSGKKPFFKKEEEEKNMKRH